MTRAHRGQQITIGTDYTGATTIDCKGKAGGTLVKVSGSVTTVTASVRSVVGGTWGEYTTYTIDLSSASAAQLADYIHGAVEVKFKGNATGVLEIGLED